MAVYFFSICVFDLLDTLMFLIVHSFWTLWFATFFFCFGVVDFGILWAFFFGWIVKIIFLLYIKGGVLVSYFLPFYEPIGEGNF